MGLAGTGAAAGIAIGGFEWNVSVLAPRWWNKSPLDVRTGEAQAVLPFSKVLGLELSG